MQSKIKNLIFLLVIFFLWPDFVLAAPSITNISSAVNHNSQNIISGAGFGSKNQANPVAWDNLEDGVLNNTATIGSWSSTGTLSISELNNRNVFSDYNAFRNFDGDISPWGAYNDEAAFTGGADDMSWFAQYWFYLADDFAFASSGNDSLGNIKIFRMWSTGSARNNFVMATSGRYDVHLSTEYVGGAENWSPVLDGYAWVDNVLGHGDPGYVDPTNIGWKNFENDITIGTWHLFQFEFMNSDINVSNGKFKMWFDGKLLMDKSNVLTRDTDDNGLMRPKYVGFYDSHQSTNNDGNNHFYIDDAYIDNTFARIELCPNNNWSDKGLCEIQIPSAWSDNSITFTANQGSFNNGDTAYLYVVDENGEVNENGYPIIIGELAGDVSAPNSPSGLSVL